jgi:hypothetical protein
MILMSESAGGRHSGCSRALMSSGKTAAAPRGVSSVRQLPASRAVAGRTQACAGVTSGGRLAEQWLQGIVGSQT